MSAQSPNVKRWLKRFLVIMTILVVGLILAFLVITPPSAETRSVAVLTENENSIQRDLEASAARYTALAEFYITKNDDRQRSFDANAARHTALAAYYKAKNDGRQRGLDASAARHTALAAYYGAENTDLQRGLDAAAARYGALAEYFAANAP